MHHDHSPALACNQRDLAALAAVDDPPPRSDELKKLAEPPRRRGKSYAGCNPAREAAVRFRAAAAAGDQIAPGCRHPDIHAALYVAGRRAPQRQRPSAAVGRLRQHLLLRTEGTTKFTPNLGINQGVAPLPQLRAV